MPVKELQDSTEGEADGEEHGGMAAARGMGALHQPQGVVHHIWKHIMGVHAHLESKRTFLMKTSDCLEDLVQGELRV